MKKDVVFEVERYRGGATLVGAYSVRPNKDVTAPILASGDLVVGRPSTVQLAPGNYWMLVVMIVIENLNGVYGYRITCNGETIESQQGDVNTTANPKDHKLIEEWVQITVA